LISLSSEVEFVKEIKDSTVQHNFASKSAYLLVYKLREEIKKPKIPSSLVEFVETENKKQVQEITKLNYISEQRSKENSMKIKLFKTLANQFKSDFTDRAVGANWSADMTELNDRAGRPKESDDLTDRVGGMNESGDPKDRLYIGMNDLMHQIDVTTSDIQKPKKPVEKEMIECPCGNLNPTMLTSCKLIPKISLETLFELGISFQKTYNEICRKCFDDMALEYREYYEHLNDTEVEKQKGDKVYYISKDYLFEWRKKVPFKGVMVSPNDEEYKHDIYCVHDCLKVDSIGVPITEKFYKLLQTRFPGLELLSTNEDVCCICEVDENERKLDPEGLQEIESQSVMNN
jgi:hypothetical protein